MTAETVQAQPEERRAFEADVAKLLHMMVHSVYSDREVFLRELISNAADACEKLRYEAIAHPELLADGEKPAIAVEIDAENGLFTVSDNGIGMTREEMTDALGTIARSGTRAFMDRLDAGKSPQDKNIKDKPDSEDADTASSGTQLIGQFGVGFYSTFMVADRVDVTSRKAGTDEAARWTSDGKGSFTVASVPAEEAPAHGTRVILHLMEDAKEYTQRTTVERIIKAHSGHVPVPISLTEAGQETAEVADGAALWTKPRQDISKEAYTDFYRGLAGQFDEPDLTVHYRAEGRQEYTALAFVPGSKPLDLFDPERKGRMKLYVRRVLISDEAEVVPGYLRFVRGLVDSADLPLNLSREMIQESPVMAAIKRGLTNRILSDLDKLAANDTPAYEKVWDTFGPVIKEGLYEDFERRDQLLGLLRIKTTASAGAWRTLKDYVGSLKENQTAIYYVTGEDLQRLEDSPQLEGFRARVIEVLLLADPVDSFWVTSASGFDGKPFKSVTQGATDLAAIALLEKPDEVAPETSAQVASFLTYAKELLGDAVAEVRASDRLTESAVCLVAPEFGPDRRLEKILAGAGRLNETSKPVLELNPRHALVTELASAREAGRNAAFVEDATRLLFDEARILDGDVPLDPKAFSQRLSRVLSGR